MLQGYRMDWRRGLFRVWVVVSVLWAIVAAFMFYPDVFYEYGLTKMRHVYDVTLPDGRAIKIISPTDAAAASLAENEKKWAEALHVAPKCKNGGETCPPWERQWEDSELALLPGATVNEAGGIVGPYSIVDDKSYAEAQANLANALKTAALASVLPPAALGLLLLGSGWICKVSAAANHNGRRRPLSSVFRAFGRGA